MPATRGHTPTAADSVYHVRLCPSDRMAAQREADRKGVALSTWIRMIVLEWLEKEREHGK